MNSSCKVLALIAAALLLASCSYTPAATAAVSPAQTPASTPANAVPIPTANVIPDLPDPALWAPSLKIDTQDYPKVDGSTATLPLAIFMRSKTTGESLLGSTAATAFSTTGPAWEALAASAADLLVVYEAPDEVKDRLNKTGVKLISKPIGRDALVFLANQDNPVKNLTHQQILDIYTGKTANWKDVGGEDIQIIPYQRISNSGSQALMLKLVMKGTKMMTAPSILQPGEMGELVDDIASYDNTGNALGYSVFYYVRNMYKVPGIKLLNINGVAPSPETIASGAYPYVNPFYAVIRSDEPADSNTYKLFDWLTGPEGKRAIVDAGYVAAS